jgi:hypothetical protein
MRATQQSRSARALILSLTLVVGCTVRWISTYDETTDKDVTALEHKVDALFTSLDVPIPITHEKAAAQYTSIYSDLHTLIVRNEARDKNELTTQQLRLLDSNIQTFEKLHMAPDFKRELVSPAKASIDQIFRAILKLELAKRET